jgi:hypothetical protein
VRRCACARCSELHSAQSGSYLDEIAAATAQLSTNAGGYARVTIRPLLSAEEMDKAVAKMPPIRVPQQQ